MRDELIASASSTYYAVFILVILLAFPLTLSAHGFGERYDLPIPLSFYLTSSALAVVLSFVVIAFFVRGNYLVSSYPKYCVWSTRKTSSPLTSVILHGLRIFSVAVFLLIIFSALFGKQNPFENIAPTAIWVIWWVGFSYFVGIFGNLWPLINPWAIVFSWLEKLSSKLFSRSRLALMLPWPSKLASWPAVFLFGWFIWAELIWPQSDSPIALAYMLLSYSVITWLGMWLFGRDTWLEHAEIFTLFFSFLGRFSPTEFADNKSTIHPLSNRLNNSRSNHLIKNEPEGA